MLKSIFTKNKIKAFFKEAIETIVFVVVMVIIIRFFIGEIRWIPSGSMRPTLLEGDRVFVERFSRFYDTPHRGDILVFYPPSENLKNDPWSVFSRLTGFFCKDIAYIKRVVGLPNEKIDIVKNSDETYSVKVDGKALNEAYVLDPEDYTECNEKMTCSILIPEGNYFMMGDNRANSQDSRFWGTLEQQRVIGKAKFIFWPLSRIEYFKKPVF